MLAYKFDVLHYLGGSLIVKLDNVKNRIPYFFAYDDQSLEKHRLTSSFARADAGTRKAASGEY